jgi:hypothetical protein
LDNSAHAPVTKHRRFSKIQQIARHTAFKLSARETYSGFPETRTSQEGSDRVQPEAAPLLPFFVG